MDLRRMDVAERRPTVVAVAAPVSVLTAVLGGALLAIVEIYLLSWIADVHLFGLLVLGLLLAGLQAAWIAGRHVSGGAVWATAIGAALAYVVIVIAVLGALLSTVDSFR
jgi:hypothetical protein